jgi:hypothetical protein
MAKKPRFDQKLEVRKLARERVGTVKPARPIEERNRPDRIKHKKPIDPNTE